jgi:acylphosphatase
VTAGGAVRRRVVVRGRVQGVFFRDSCRAEAVRLGIGGWVRNLRDGSVEAVFEGDAPAVDAAVVWCRHGPPRAHVAEVSVVEEDDAVEGLGSFRIVGGD